jgi:hypothetical protein
MSAHTDNPFDSIETAHEFLALLSTNILEAKHDLEIDIEREIAVDGSRRLDALRLALYNLQKLESNMNRSRRLLNDLRTLRRLLFEERTLRRRIPKDNAKAATSVDA